MSKGAIVLLAGHDGSHENLGRVANALESVEQFKDAGDEVKLVFDGAGTEWVSVLTDKEHDLNPKFQKIQDKVHGACQFCANAFEVRQEIEDSPVDLVDEHNRHPNIRNLVADGFEVITF